MMMKKAATTPLTHPEESASVTLPRPLLALLTAGVIVASIIGVTLVSIFGKGG
jgi:hypothetical protein